MQLAKGTIVRSMAGHDKGDFQVIMAFDDTFAWVCDGKYRPLSRLKKKNLKHIKLTNTILDESRLLTDKSIRTALRDYDKTDVEK